MSKRIEAALLALAMLVTVLAYSPGLAGGFEFDDYPNIVDAELLHVTSTSASEWLSAAWASPSSDLQRPLASLSFATNHYFTGLDPKPMKWTNLFIHLVNGWLIWLLLTGLVRQTSSTGSRLPTGAPALPLIVAALWLAHPINLTGVLYTVQRMESLAQLFVLAGLIVYLQARIRLLNHSAGSGWRLWLALPACLLAGVSAKESAALLPLYALVIEWALPRSRPVEMQLRVFFLVVLVVPGVLGVLWLLPRVLSVDAFALRDFSLDERLLTQPRVLWSYISWTVLPVPGVFGFYRDDLQVSTGLFSPWNTVLALMGLLGVAVLAFALRKRQPLIALGLGWFLSAHVLTATVLPLEMVFEHRNYFSSIGILLAVSAAVLQLFHATRRRGLIAVVLGALFTLSCFTLILRSYEWGDPVRLAISEAQRNENSPRARYNLGLTLLKLSDFDQDSPLFQDAVTTFEAASRLPKASLLPDIGLIQIAGRTGQEPNPERWANVSARLRARRPTPEESTAIRTLVQCQLRGWCELPDAAVLEMLLAGSNHEPPDSMVLFSYAQFAYNRLADTSLALELAEAAAAHGDPQYQLNLVNFLVDLDQVGRACSEFDLLKSRLRPGQFRKYIQSITSRLDCATHPSGAKT